MAIMYKKHTTDRLYPILERVSDGAWIPLDNANTDYQEFLRLAAEQGEENILEAAE